MSLTNAQSAEIEYIVESSLDIAERNWGRVGRLIVKSATYDSAAMESVEIPSLIPGHITVTDGIPKLETFVALVVDMRNSTQRLSTQISAAKANGFERVYYETSALLPALAKVITYENGSVTEFLGDGVLALFATSIPHDKPIKAAYRAAENCIVSIREIVNSKIKERYNLPPMDLGAGLSLGETMVTIVGVGDNVQPKALGPCIYEASKLSGGVNKIVVSKSLKSAWPKSDGGGLRFQEEQIKTTTGFSVRRSEKEKSPSRLTLFLNKKT